MTQIEPVPLSEPTPKRSRSPMQIVGERQTQDSPQRQEGTTAWEGLTPSPSPRTTTSTLQPELEHRAAWKAGVLGAVNVLAMVLAGRLLVLVAVAGAIFLTFMSIGNPDLFRLVALGIYCLTAIGGTVWLASQGR